MTEDLKLKWKMQSNVNDFLSLWFLLHKEQNL